MPNDINAPTCETAPASPLGGAGEGAPRPSRRALMGNSAAMLLACTGVSAVATATPAVASDHPDHLLITDCAEFARLEREMRALPDAQCEASYNRLGDQQRPLFQIVCATPATTLDGLRAKAATARMWNAERRYSPELEDGWITDFVTSIWRDLGGPVAPWCNHEPRYSGRFTAPTGTLACRAEVEA